MAVETAAEMHDAMLRWPTAPTSWSWRPPWPTSARPGWPPARSRRKPAVPTRRPRADRRHPRRPGSAASRTGQVLVGFAAETSDLRANASGEAGPQGRRPDRGQRRLGPRGGFRARHQRRGHPRPRRSARSRCPSPTSARWPPPSSMWSSPCSPELAGPGSASRARVAVSARHVATVPAAIAPARSRQRTGVQVTSWTFTSESVTEGHPDKMADQISDSILDAMLAQDPRAGWRARPSSPPACASSAARSPPPPTSTSPRIVRKTICDIGYDRGSFGYDGNTCGVMVAIDEQSPDIAQGVDASEEVRAGTSGEDELEQAGRRRPGDDVRLRLRRDRRADAAADPPRPPPGRAAGRGAQVRRDALPAARRQDPGHLRVRGRRAGARSRPC